MNQKEQVIVGAVKVNKTWKYLKNNYECAAWYEEHEACLGTYPIVLTRSYHYPKTLLLTAHVNAKVIDDYFPALWAGVSIGNEPSKKKHLGEDRIIYAGIDFEKAMDATGAAYEDDMDIFLHPDWWTVFKVEAEEELHGAYHALPKFWNEYKNLDPETFQPRLEGRYDFRMEYESKVSMIAHFGESLRKWSRRLENISRKSKYVGEKASESWKELYEKNTAWAKKIEMTKFEGMCPV